MRDKSCKRKIVSNHYLFMGWLFEMGYRKGEKERLKPLSLYGYDLEEAIRAILSVNPKKLREAGKTIPGTKPAKEQRGNEQK